MIDHLSTKDIEEIFDILFKNYPDPKTELYYTSPYTLLVAVILSAQATDVGVNKVTPNLFAIADTPSKMIALGEENLKKYVSSINYYNNKARNIILSSKMLLEKFDGNVPNDFDSLNSLAGIGRKSANVILNSIWNLDVIPVDTHVFRVSNRLGLCNTTTPLETELALMNVIPKRWLKYAHHLLVLHGRYVCKSRKPLCDKCCLKHLCCMVKT